MLGDLAAGGGISYRPLLGSHLSDGPLSESVRRAVAVIEDCSEWEALAAEPEVARFCPPGLREGDARRWEEDEAVAVVLRDRGGSAVQGVIVGRLDRFDRRLADVSTFWVWNPAWLHDPGVVDVLAGGWLALFRALAKRGAVGVTVSETWSGRDFVDVLRRIAGFRPAAEVYGDLGLSPADGALVVAEWRATIEGDRVTRFATRPELDDTAHRELIRLLDAFFRVANPSLGDPGDAAPPPGLRVTVTGEVGIDGVRGYGIGLAPGDWYQPPPDVIPEGPDEERRIPLVLAAWLHDQP